MFFYNTIERQTLELLRRIQSISDFQNLRLVGGTALALQIGHRSSVDLDFFGELTLDWIELNGALRTAGKVTVIKQTQNMHIFSINGIKVDFVNYPYPWLKDAVSEDDIILADIDDIAPMKLSAVTNRGTKKDFIDIYHLLRRFSLEDILSLYEKKYSDGSPFLVLKSLTYFDDADEDEPPLMFDNTEWNDVKCLIRNEVSRISRNY